MRCFRRDSRFASRRAAFDRCRFFFRLFESEYRGCWRSRFVVFGKCFDMPPLLSGGAVADLANDRDAPAPSFGFVEEDFEEGGVLPTSEEYDWRAGGRGSLCSDRWLGTLPPMS